MEDLQISHQINADGIQEFVNEEKRDIKDNAQLILLLCFFQYSNSQMALMYYEYQEE